MTRREIILMLLAFIFVVLFFGVYKYFGLEIRSERGRLLGSIGGGEGDEVNVAGDNYPWINTSLYENMKEPETYTTSEATFVADHYDLAVGHLQNVSSFIKQRNPDIKIIAFSGLAQISDYYGQKLQQFLNLPENQGQYTDVEKEDVYLHYKCDVNVYGRQIMGCNYNQQTNQCLSQPAPGCSASTAQNRSQSRVPDWWLPSWLSSNYNSRLYKDFGPWRLKEILGFYPDSVPADGIWWDNILYLPGYVAQIEKTIEYFGEADSQNSQHTRNIDYNNYYLDVKLLVEQVYPNARIWLGNVNGMYWIRQGGPYINWVLGNLSDFAPESWISPRAAGEYAMPSWLVDCPDLKEVWTYTVANGKNLHVLTYNNPVDSNAPRTEIFSIIKYYLIKNSRLYYGYTEEPLSENGFPNNEWNKMAEINIGQPRLNPPGVKDFDGFTNTDKFFDWLNPSSQVSCSYQGRDEVVAARHFENGLVIARWKANRCDVPGPECNSYVDPRNYPLSNPYGSSYYVVQLDGTIPTSPVQSITLRTNEAALLVKACGDGQVPQGETCGCGGQILGGGEWCCGGTEKFVCTSDAECKATGEGGPDVICTNPGTCQAACVEAPPPPPGPYSLTVSKFGTGGGTVISTPSGIDCGSDCAQDFPADTQITLSAIPRNDSIFGGWSGACSGANNVCVFIMNSNLSVSASFNLIQIPPETPCTSGESRSCQIGSCAGNQICANGVWSNCAQTDLCCGVNCNDNNSCTEDSCAGGVCSHVNVCPSPPPPPPPPPLGEDIGTPPPRAESPDINRINEALSQIGKSFKTILYVLNVIAVLAFIIALLY